MAQLAYEIAKQRIASNDYDVDLSGLWDLEEVPELSYNIYCLDVSNTSVSTLSPSNIAKIQNLWCHKTNITSLPTPANYYGIELYCEYWRFKEIQKTQIPHDEGFFQYKWRLKSFLWNFESTDSKFRKWTRKLLTKLEADDIWYDQDHPFSRRRFEVFPGLYYQYFQCSDRAWPSWHKTWLIKEELMSVAWHTDRVEAWCGEAWDVDASS